MPYEAVKWIHILSSTILFGFGLGSAFWMFMANRSKDVAAIAFATRMVVLADWAFTTPAIIIQPLSGLWLVHLAGFELWHGWVMWAICLYGFAGLCWLPVVWMQLKMKALAQIAYAQDAALPALYWHYDRAWIVLGSLAFPAIVWVFWLMVAKP
jgi:uncharacterized membrane protein